MDELVNLANSVLATKVPELTVLLLLVITVFIGLWKLFGKVTEAQKDSVATLVETVNTLESRHEANETRLAETTALLTQTSHRFHEKLLESTHKVIMDNTIQSALTQQVLNQVLDKVK